MRYKIFQLNEDKIRAYGFMGLEQLKADGLVASPDNYHEVWGSEEKVTLEELFYRFNLEKPQGYKGRSMSLSDVVAIQDTWRGYKISEWEYWYCDTVGWTKLLWEGWSL